MCSTIQRYVAAFVLVAILVFGPRAEATRSYAPESSNAGRATSADQTYAAGSQDAVKHIFWHPSTSMPTFLTGVELTGRTLSPGAEGASNPELIADAFLRAYRSDIGIDFSASDWTVVRIEPDEVLKAATTVRLQQQYHGIPVFGGEVLVHVADGRIRAVNGQFIRSIDVPLQPHLTP